MSMPIMVHQCWRNVYTLDWQGNETARQCGQKVFPHDDLGLCSAHLEEMQEWSNDDGPAAHIEQRDSSIQALPTEVVAELLPETRAQAGALYWGPFDWQPDTRLRS